MALVDPYAVRGFRLLAGQHRAPFGNAKRVLRLVLTILLDTIIYEQLHCGEFISTIQWPKEMPDAASSTSCKGRIGAGVHALQA